jgi:hypothetical protein
MCKNYFHQYGKLLTGASQVSLPPSPHRTDPAKHVLTGGDTNAPGVFFGDT